MCVLCGGSRWSQATGENSCQAAPGTAAQMGMNMRMATRMTRRGGRSLHSFEHAFKVQLLFHKVWNMYLKIYKGDLVEHKELGKFA